MLNVIGVCVLILIIAGIDLLCRRARVGNPEVSVSFDFAAIGMALGGGIAAVLMLETNTIHSEFGRLILLIASSAIGAVLAAMFAPSEA